LRALTGAVGAERLRAHASGRQTARSKSREISNTIVAAAEEGTINDRNLSVFVYARGQFIDHDMDLTLTPFAAAPTNIRHMWQPADAKTLDGLV
jgi:hypothetical protein